MDSSYIYRIYALFMLLCMICVCAVANSELKVQAKSVESDLKKGQTVLSGEVIVTKGEDTLWADKVVVETNKKNEPLKYTATGNVRFYAKMPDKQMKGRAKKAIYDVKKDEYQLIDNAIIEEIGKNNTIKGNIITLNPTTQEASVRGSESKPSVLTFILDEKEQK